MASLPIKVSRLVLEKPPCDGVAVGGRLREFLPVWATVFGPEAQNFQTLSRGVSLRFRDQRPPLTRDPVKFPCRSSALQLKVAVDKLLSKGVVSLVRDSTTPGFYSRLFLVPKKNGELRPVIDLSVLNRLMVVPTFTMESQQSVRSAVRPGDWATSIDIRDAYLHVPMTTSVQKLLRFQVGSGTYQFRVLPFGLSTSPREFTKLLSPLLLMLRKQGIRVHVYLDDWLIRADSPEVAQEHTFVVANVLQCLGWILNLEKSSLNPSQNFQFLGLRFCTEDDTVIVTPIPDIQVRLVEKVCPLLEAPHLSARKLSSIMGLVVYLAPLVPGGFYNLRPLQWLVRALWCQSTGRWSDQLTLSPEILELLQWWLTPVVFKGVPASWPVASATITTDASMTGWGASYGDRKMCGVWLHPHLSWHINALELRAVLLSLREFSPALQGRVVRVMLDNQTAVAYLRKSGGIRSRRLNSIALETLKFADSIGVHLVPVFIPGRLNVTADGLSRIGQVRETEWVLRTEVLQQVFRQLGVPWLDLFATRDNSRLAHFVSPHPHPMAYHTDALSLEWSSLGLLYAFPPWKLVTEVLKKFRASSNVALILIAPMKAAASWLPELMELSRARIPLSHPQLLSQHVTGLDIVFHQTPMSLALHAWLL